MADGSVRVAAGEFGSGSFANGAGHRDFKLFVPDRYHGQELPLIVMLHGCTQNPDDFAAGTRMNTVANEHDCLVLYPQQSTAANSSLCWNWFSALDQQRDQGEPSIIADLTREIIATYGIDRHRIFIAGMSAGGAMALILAVAYPDLYSAVGVHSGIPYQAARNVLTAMSVMRRGAEDYVVISLKDVRVIVFHGGTDKTVNPLNGEQVILQLLGTASAHPGKLSTVQTGATNGRSYDRKTFRDLDGTTVAEHWSVHKTGHAWSGGSAAGSYADPSGPNASYEMVRFFLRAPDDAEIHRGLARRQGVLRRALQALKLVPRSAR